jgi:hypothetical protein
MESLLAALLDVHTAQEAAERNKSHPNTVAVDTLQGARWESGFQVLIQVVSVR